LKAVVLAAGKGTRMRGLCDERPKPIMPLANRPALSLTIERLAEAGIKDVLVIVGHRPEKIKETLARRPIPGVNISYEVQKGLNGTGEATMIAEGFVGGDAFVLTFGDVVAHSENYARAIKAFEQGADGVLSTYDIGRAVKVGAVFVENNCVARIIERPGPDEAGPLVSAGLFIFPPQIFEATRDLPPAPSGEHELTGGIQKLVDAGCKLRAMPITGFWSNLTDPDALLEANEHVERELVEKGEKLIDDASDISPEATMRKTAAVARDARIGTGAILGRNVSIGRGSVVGESCLLEHCIVLENASIGNYSQLENTIIDSGANVPNGAILRSPAGHASIIWRTTYR